MSPFKSCKHFFFVQRVSVCFLDSPLCATMMLVSYKLGIWLLTDADESLGNLRKELQEIQADRARHSAQTLPLSVPDEKTIPAHDEDPEYVAWYASIHSSSSSPTTVTLSNITSHDPSNSLQERERRIGRKSQIRLYKPDQGQSSGKHEKNSRAWRPPEFGNAAKVDFLGRNLMQYVPSVPKAAAHGIARQVRNNVNVGYYVDCFCFNCHISIVTMQQNENIQSPPSHQSILTCINLCLALEA